MNTIEEIFKEYLTTKTDYAFLVKGKWGIGKTYFYKNILEQTIKETKTLNDASSFFKPVYISMYGIKSIEDLQYNFFISLTNQFIGKKFKPSKDLISAISKGILSYKGLGALQEIASQFGKYQLNKINLSDVVICFDDLERMHNDFNIEEFLGYINNLVEHQNTKVLIIGNESEIKDDRYQIIKEKTIGISTYFKLNFKEVVINIIDNYFNPITDKDLNTFLHNNISLIININNNDETNLRSLSFALKKFESIYYQILDSSEKIIKNYQTKILYDAYKFTLLISLEYRKGNLDLKRTNDLDNVLNNYSFVLVNELFGGKENAPLKKEDLTYSDKFVQDYYSYETFRFYQSLFNYVVGGEIFQLYNFLKEYKEHNYIENDEITKQYEVFQSLSYPNLFKLNDKEYIKLSQEMIEYTKQGLYNIDHYIIVFAFIVRFNNPLNFDLDLLTEIISRGLEKAYSKGNLKYIVEIADKLYINDASSKNKHQLIIKEKTIEINNRIWEEMKKEKAIHFQNLLLNDINQLTQEYIVDKRNIYLTNDSFKYMDAGTIFMYYKESSNSKKYELNEFFNKKMQFHRYRDEIPFFNSLESLIDKEIKKNTQIVSKQLLLKLKKILSVLTTP